MPVEIFHPPLLPLAPSRTPLPLAAEVAPQSSRIALMPPPAKASETAHLIAQSDAAVPLSTRWMSPQHLSGLAGSESSSGAAPPSSPVGSAGSGHPSRLDLDALLQVIERSTTAAPVIAFFKRSLSQETPDQQMDIALHTSSARARREFAWDPLPLPEQVTVMLAIARLAADLQHAVPPERSYARFLYEIAQPADLIERQIVYTDAQALKNGRYISEATPQPILGPQVRQQFAEIRELHARMALKRSWKLACLDRPWLIFGLLRLCDARRRYQLAGASEQAQAIQSLIERTAHEACVTEDAEGWAQKEISAAITRSTAPLSKIQPGMPLDTLFRARSTSEKLMEEFQWLSEGLYQYYPGIFSTFAAAQSAAYPEGRLNNYVRQFQENCDFYPTHFVPYALHLGLLTQQAALPPLPHYALASTVLWVRPTLF